MSLYFESNGVEKVGLSLLLMQESLWTIAPPPGDESLYLSVPVDRLPERSPGLVNGTQYKYLYPWEFNYFNYNGPPIDKIVSLAAELMQCNKKKLPAMKKACKFAKLLKSFFQGFKVEDIPVPPGLEEAVLKLTGALTPEQMLLLLTTLIPIELLQELNNNAVTAIDYDWVHRHLFNTLDPDIGYEDKQQPWLDCFAENDIFCQHGSYPFPLPSDSVDMGDPDLRSTQKAKPKCGEWCEYLKRPIFTTTGKPGQPGYTKRPAKFTKDKKPVPQWVRDIIQAALDRGESGNIVNPPNGPDDMEVDPPIEVPDPPRGGDPVKGGAPWTRIGSGDAAFWFPKQGSSIGMETINRQKKFTPEQAAENLRRVNDYLAAKGLTAWWKDATPQISSRSAQRTVKPVFDDIILYDDEDDEYLNIPSRPIFPSLTVRSPASSLLYNIQSLSSGTIDNMPICINILDLQGTNQTQAFDRTVLVHTVRPNKTVETLVDTQLVGTASTVVFVNCLPAGTVGRTTNPFYSFTLLSGTDRTLILNDVISGGVLTVTAPAVGSTVGTSMFTIATVADPHIAYRTFTIRNGNTVNPTRSIWRITQQAGFHATTGIASRLLIRDTPFTPAFNSFTSNGFVNASGLNSGVDYVSLPFSCRPQYQIPIGLQLYNETNLKSYAPNSRVIPNTLGYALGQSGNTGNTLAGSYYLPFNPTGVTAVTNYDITVQKSQGQMLLQSLLTFGL